MTQMSDTALASDGCRVEKYEPGEGAFEFLGKTWEVTWTLEKREGDWSPEQIAAGLAPAPYEMLVVPDNGLLNNGIDNLLMRLIGGPGRRLPGLRLRLRRDRVGNSTTAFSASQTDLQGTQAESTMDAGYPTVASQVVTWKATFGSSAANFAWEEVGVKNQTGAVSATRRLLNRKVQSFGTKVSGATWTMTLAITVS
jgi:hypothetical protein